jgi:hypothetical protein
VCESTDRRYSPIVSLSPCTADTNGVNCWATLEYAANPTSFSSLLAAPASATCNSVSFTPKVKYLLYSADVAKVACAATLGPSVAQALDASEYRSADGSTAHAADVSSHDLDGKVIYIIAQLCAHQPYALLST